MLLKFSQTVGSKDQLTVGHGGNELELKKKKLTAPGIPRRSPIQVLTRPDPA